MKATIVLLLLLPLPVLYACGNDVTGPEGGLQAHSGRTPVFPTLVVFPDFLTLKPGDSSQFGIFLERRGPDLVPPELKVIWSSSDPAVATVSENGEISALQEGSAVIQANYGGLTAEAGVMVSDNVVPINDHHG
ncbi:MAG: Ig-like domain-containing protein [Gemmatimonadota bacterium]